MADQSLELKYRPKNFDEFVGNQSVVAALESMLQREEGKKHSLMFVGPSGCGKTTLARIVATELGAGISDLAEFNIANMRGIDNVRDLAQKSKFRPLTGAVRVYILDEIQQMTKDGQQALLKILEEAPDHTYYMLCTTEMEKLLPTIRNRCAIFEVSPLRKPELITLLKRILEQEKVEDFPEEALEEIVKVSEGSPRKALVILDKVIDIEDEDLLIKAIKEQTFDEATVIELCRALLAGDWNTVKKVLKSINEEPENVRYAVLGYMSKVLLNNGGSREAEIIDIFSDSFMYGKKGMLVGRCWMACNVK